MKIFMEIVGYAYCIFAYAMLIVLTIGSVHRMFKKGTDET